MVTAINANSNTHGATATGFNKLTSADVSLLKPVAVAPWVLELALIAVTNADAVLFPVVRSEVRVAASAF